MTVTPAISAPLGIPGAPAQSEVRVYVACLAAYNSGILHGRWIDASSGADHLSNETRAMLAASPVPDAEEHALHDYEGFEGADLSEYASFETVCEMAKFIAVHGRLGAKLYRHFGNDLGQARAAFEDYAGAHSLCVRSATPMSPKNSAITACLMRLAVRRSTCATSSPNR